MLCVCCMCVDNDGYKCQHRNAHDNFFVINILEYILSKYKYDIQSLQLLDG